MKRYLISSPKFSGEAELVYRESLEIIDCSKTDMSDKQKDWLIKVAPMYERDIEAAFTNSTARIVPENVVIEFEAWWKLYNKKVNKDRALKIWDKIKVTEQVNAWIGTLKYNKYLSKETWQSKADPETYLKNKYWNNEYK